MTVLGTGVHLLLLCLFIYRFPQIQSLLLGHRAVSSPALDHRWVAAVIWPAEPVLTPYFCEHRAKLQRRASTVWPCHGVYCQDKEAQREEKTVEMRVRGIERDAIHSSSNIFLFINSISALLALSRGKYWRSSRHKSKTLNHKNNCKNHRVRTIQSCFFF